MKLLSDIIKGVFIGIANIIPGVSGGTMAVSMGIYDKIIYSVTHLFKEFKKSVSTLFPYFLGAAIGLVALSFAIEFLFENYPLQTNLTFIGLILGGLPAILSRIHIKKIQVNHCIIFMLFFSLIIGLKILDGQTGANVILEFSIFEAIKLFFIGMIASATMVIPGVSGSMILMLIGYYEPIIQCINEFIKALTTFNSSIIFQNALILIPFGLGVIIGIFAIAKLIEMLLAKFEALTFIAILGLVVASPIAILMGINFSGITAITIITSFVCFSIGLCIAYFLGRE